MKIYPNLWDAANITRCSNYTHLRDYRKSVFLHRFIQCCMKGGLNALDSLGQNFAAEFCPQWPAAFLRSA